METDDGDDLVCAVSSVVVALVARSCWIWDWLQKRPQHGTHVALLSSLQSSDPSTYRNFCRMAPDDYDDMYPLVSSLRLHLAIQVDTSG